MDPQEYQKLRSGTPDTITLHSLQVGEVWALSLGCGLSTFAVLARVYTKLRLTRTLLREDCKVPLASMSSLRAIANPFQTSPCWRL